MKDNEPFREAASHLAEGKVILCPTDTIWGLSCDATNSEAVNKIYSIKGRSLEKSFIVLVNSYRMINQLFSSIPDIAWDLFDQAQEALTLILDNASYVAPSVINKDGSLAVRFVKSGECNKILTAFGKPIVSTSPNFSGQPSPGSFREIDEGILDQVDYTYPIHQNSGDAKKPSKIIKLSPKGEVYIIRK